MGFHQEDLDGPAVGTRDPLFFGGTDVHLVGHGLVEGGEAGQGLIPEGVAPDLDRLPHPGLREVDRLLVGARHELPDALAFEHAGDPARGQVHPAQGPMALLLHGEPERLPVRGPLEGVHPVVDGLREHPAGLQGPVVDRQPEAVRLATGADLQPVGDVAPIRRVLGILVRGRVVGGDAAGRVIPVQGDEEQVLVGAPGRYRVAVRGDADLPAIGAQGPGLPEGGMVLPARSERFHLALEGRREELRVLEIAPLGPVAVEQGIRQVGLHGTQGQLLAQHLLFRAVGAGFGKHRGLEHHLVRTGNHPGCLDPRLEGRDLAGLSATGVQSPELAAPLAVRQEVEGPAVPGPLGNRVRLAREGELPRRPARHLQHPELGAALRGPEVLAGHFEGQPRTVRTEGQVLQTLETVQVLDLEGALFGGGEGQGQEQGRSQESK